MSERRLGRADFGTREIKPRKREFLKSTSLSRGAYRHKSDAKFADLSTGGRFSKEYRRVAGMRSRVCLLYKARARSLLPAEYAAFRIPSARY